MQGADFKQRLFLGNCLVLDCYNDGFNLCIDKNCYNVLLFPRYNPEFSVALAVNLRPNTCQGIMYSTAF